MELFDVPGFSTQRLARGSPFQHSPLKLYNTRAVNMRVESKPAAPLHPSANYLQGERMFIEKVLSCFQLLQGNKETRELKRKKLENYPLLNILGDRKIMIMVHREKSGGLIWR